MIDLNDYGNFEHIKTVLNTIVTINDSIKPYRFNSTKIDIDRIEKMKIASLQDNEKIIVESIYDYDEFMSSNGEKGYNEISFKIGDIRTVKMYSKSNI